MQLKSNAPSYYPCQLGFPVIRVKLEPDKYAAAVTSQETLCREHGSAISVNLLPSAPTHIVSKVLVLDADIVYCILTGVSAQHAKILIQYT